MINSPPDNHTLAPIAPPATPSGTDLELVRQRSIRVLGAVAAALETTGQQCQSVQAEVRAAEQTLQRLVDARELAAAALASARAQINAAVALQERARTQGTAILSDVESVLSAGLQIHAALHADIDSLERQRAELASIVAGSRSLLAPRPAPVAAGGPHPVPPS